MIEASLLEIEASSPTVPSNRSETMKPLVIIEDRATGELVAENLPKKMIERRGEIWIGVARDDGVHALEQGVHRAK